MFCNDVQGLRIVVSFTEHFYVVLRYITQYSMENEREFVIPPAYFDQIAPSSVRTWKVQRKNY